jgi:hypothetical protein
MWLEGTGAAANNTWYTFIGTGSLAIIIIRQHFKKLNNTRQGLQMGTIWEAGFGYIVLLWHNSRMSILLGQACLTSSSHLGIRWLWLWTGQETKKKWNSKASGHTGGKQAQGIKTDRSGPWWVTILEREKGIQDVPLHLVDEMLKLWEDKWATETENENWHELTPSWQQISPNESFLWKWIHVISEIDINNYSGIVRYIWCEILSTDILVH